MTHIARTNKATNRLLAEDLMRSARDALCCASHVPQEHIPDAIRVRSARSAILAAALLDDPRCAARRPMMAPPPLATAAPPPPSCFRRRPVAVLRRRLCPA